jgi:hypothetical protein
MFETVEIPTVTRPGAENPYKDAVESIVGTGKALSFKIFGERPAPTEKGYEGNKAIGSVLRLLGLAGELQNPPVTVRKTAKVEGKDTRITFWTTDRIVHGKRENKSEDVTA